MLKKGSSVTIFVRNLQINKLSYYPLFSHTFAAKNPSGIINISFLLIFVFIKRVIFYKRNFVILETERLVDFLKQALKRHVLSRI